MFTAKDTYNLSTASQTIGENHSILLITSRTRGFHLLLIYYLAIIVDIFCIGVSLPYYVTFSHVRNVSLLNFVSHFGQLCRDNAAYKICWHFPEPFGIKMYSLAIIELKLVVKVVGIHAPWWCDKNLSS